MPVVWVNFVRKERENSPKTLLVSTRPDGNSEKGLLRETYVK